MASEESKDIVKNLGKLHSEIIKALVNAQKVGKSDEPKSLDIDAVTTNLGTFNTLIGKDGTISTILTSLTSLDIDKSKSDNIISAITSSKSIVSKIGGLIDELGPLNKKLNGAEPVSLESVTGSIGVTLNGIKSTLEEFDAGVLTYFSGSVDDDGNKIKSSAAQRIDQIKSALGTINGLSNGLINTYGALKDIPVASINDTDAIIRQNLTGEKSILKTIGETLELINTTYMNDIRGELFGFFVDNERKVAIGDVADKAFTKTFTSSIKQEGLNEVLEKSEQYYIKDASPFAQINNRIKAALTSIKQIKSTVDTYAGIFEDKKSNTSTAQTITNWAKNVNTVSGVWGEVFGMGSATDKICKSLEEASKWNPVIPEIFEKIDVNGKESTRFYEERVVPVSAAIKSLGKVSGIFTTLIKTKDTVSGSLNGFDGAYDELFKTLIGDTNPVNIAMDLCADVDKMLTETLAKPEYQAIINRIDEENKVGPWDGQIKTAESALKAIAGLTKIPKQVVKTNDAFKKMDEINDIHNLIDDIKSQVKTVLDDIGDGINDINAIVINSGVNKIDKETAESLNTTNVVLSSISDLVNTIVTAGERMEEYGYRRLVHASIQIEFFIEILSTTLEELSDTSKELIANTPANLATAKKIETALKPIADTYETLQKLFGIIDDTKIMPNPLLKLKAKLMKNRIRNGIILINGILGELQAEIQAITPSESEKMEQFNDILEPIQSIFELVDVINKTPLPNLALFKIRAIRLRRRVLMVAELLIELQAELNNIAHGANTDTRIVRKVQATMNAIKDMVEVFSSIAGDSLRILVKGKAITPAVKMMIKQFDMFDKLIDRISKLKDTRKANNQLRRLEEVVRSIAILATSMILLVPILALFILVSPVLILGVLVFALVTKVVVMLAKTTATSKTILLIIAVTLIIGAFIAMAAMMLVLVLVVDKLKDGIGLIIGFVVGIIAFMAVLALLGLGVQYVAPFIAMAVLGIVLVTIAVGAILVMAICLKLLEFIDLDAEAIKSNVKVVIDTALECMMLAFGPQSDPRGPNQDTSFLDVIGGAFVNIIRALAASIILVLTCISVVAILVIAAMLRLLAVIDPKEMEKGAENAKTAIKTATGIMTMLFDSDKPKDKDGESNSVFGSLLTYVFEPLGKILKAIFAYYYLGIMVIAMGLVLLLCTMIRLIANFDTGKITDGKENAKLAVQAAAEIVADLFKGDDTDRTPSDRGGLLCVVGYVFGKEYEDIIRAVLAIAYVGVLILALVMISFLAKQLATIGEIDNGVLQKAKENAVLVVKTCGEIMNTIFSGDSDADTNEGEGWFKKMLKWVLPNSLVDMIDAMVKIGKLALLVIAVGAIGKLADQLTTLAKFKVSSSLAKQKAKSVIDAATTLVVNLKSLSKDADVDEDDMGRIYDLCVGLAKIPAGLQPIADNLTKLDSYKPEAIESAGLTGIKIISTMKQMVEDINDINCDVDGVNARLDIIDRISKTVGSFVKVEAEDVKNSKDLTDNYIKFFKQVDSMDLKKLQHTDWLMRSWASISRDLKGDFEGLAKTINQHIMPMLEKVNETLEKTTKAQQDIINTLSQPVDINGVGSTGGSALDFNTSTPGASTPGGGFEPTGSAQPGNTAAPKNPSGAPQLNGGSRSQNTNLEPGKKYRIIVAESKEGW